MQDILDLTPPPWLGEPKEKGTQLAVIRFQPDPDVSVLFRDHRHPNLTSYFSTGSSPQSLPLRPARLF